MGRDTLDIDHILKLIEDGTNKARWNSRYDEASNLYETLEEIKKYLTNFQNLV